MFEYRTAKRLELPYYLKKESLDDIEYFFNLTEWVVFEKKDGKPGWYYDRYLQMTWFENGEYCFQPIGERKKIEITYFKYNLGLTEQKQLTKKEKAALQILANSGIIKKKLQRKLIEEDSQIQMLKDIYRSSLKSYWPGYLDYLRQPGEVMTEHEDNDLPTE